MKFYTAGKNGAIVVLDDGEIRVAQNQDEILRMLNRLAPDSRDWTSETVECVRCQAVWCEIHLKDADQATCPECSSVLKLL